MCIYRILYINCNNSLKINLFFLKNAMMLMFINVAELIFILNSVKKINAKSLIVLKHHFYNRVIVYSIGLHVCN